uniref:Uncharacterized protein n=1 Tax=Alexandrium catenella TaxID=2925 RepID=A0A7S1MMK4_ALECA
MMQSMQSFGGEALPAAVEASLSVARLSLLQSALEILRTCPEGHMDGQQLSNKLREMHPEHVHEVTTVNNGKSRKGWLRSLLAQEPLILQATGIRNDCCFFLNTGILPPGITGGVPVGAAGGAAVGTPGTGVVTGPGVRRPISSVASAGFPDAKRQKRAPGEDITTLGAKIPQHTRMELMNGAAEALRQVAFQQDHLEGSKLADMLKQQLPGSVTAAKAAVGGKGWLRALLETTAEFLRVEVPGKVEPCYRLVDGSIPPGYTAPAAMAPGPRTVPPPRAKFGQRPTSATSFQKGQHQAHTPLPPALRDMLVQSAVSVLSASEKGYLEGARLSDALRSVHPEIVGQAKHTLGGKDGKGWLKKLVEQETSIQQLQIDAVKEPCYCVAGQAPAGATVVEAPFNAAAMAGMADPYGAALAQQGYGGMMGAQQWQQQTPMTPMLPLTGQHAPSTRAPRPRQAVPEVTPAEKAAVESLLPTIIEAACQILAAVPEFMEGNKLSQALKEQYPDVVEKTKAAMGGKGWLKKVLEKDPRIVLVKVHGLCEPCYSLYEKCGGGTVEFVREPAVRRERVPPASAEGRPLRQPTPTGQDVMEKVSQEDSAELFTSAVAILEASGAGMTGFLEGSKLAEKMKAMTPAVVDRVKTTLRKGWLKAVLELEPRIQAVEVEGRNEPCYRLIGL